MAGETGNSDSPRVSPLDAIRRSTDDGNDYWSARELGPLLGYSRWHRFAPVIAKAETACEQSGYAVADHFTHVGTMVTLGSSAKREVEDVHLSRYACYLAVQNCETRKSRSLPPARPISQHAG